MLEVRDLEVAYGAAPALWGVSLDVRSGELVCVVGPNGAGKTTLINTIAGLQRARAGRLSIDGREMPSIPRSVFSVIDSDRHNEDAGVVSTSVLTEAEAAVDVVVTGCNSLSITVDDTTR